MTLPSSHQLNKSGECYVDPAELPAYLTLIEATVSTALMPSDASALDVIAVNAGWPPRIHGIQAVTRIDPDPPARPFTTASEEALLSAILANSDVKALLHGRWEHLGTYLSCPRGYSDYCHDVRVYFHNYSAGYSVEVVATDCRVVSVAKRDAYIHPESAIEERQAVALAREDSRLKGLLTGLEGSAILQIPPDGDPVFGHRLLWVMFTESHNPTTESEALFTAMVDLDLQRVVEAGKAPCCSESHADDNSVTGGDNE